MIANRLSLLLRNRIQDDFASGMIKQVEAQKFGAFAEQLEFTGSVEEMVSGGSGVVVSEGGGHDPIDQHRELARGGSDSFGLAGTGGQASIEGAERG